MLIKIFSCVNPYKTSNPYRGSIRVFGHESGIPKQLRENLERLSIWLSNTSDDIEKYSFYEFDQRGFSDAFKCLREADYHQVTSFHQDCNGLVEVVRKDGTTFHVSVGVGVNTK